MITVIFTHKFYFEKATPLKPLFGSNNSEKKDYDHGINSLQKWD